MTNEKETKYWESVSLALFNRDFTRLNSAYWGLRSIYRPKPVDNSVADQEEPVIQYP